MKVRIWGDTFLGVRGLGHFTFVVMFSMLGKLWELSIL